MVVKFDQGSLCKSVEDSKLKAQNKKRERLLEGGAGIFALQNSRERDFRERGSPNLPTPQYMRYGSIYSNI